MGVDPDEFIKEHGAQAFSEKMKTARTSIEYLMDEIKEECDMASEEGKVQFAQRSTAIVEKYAFDSIETEMYLRRISQISGFSLDSLYSSFDKKASNTKVKTNDVAYGILNKFDSVTERAFVSVLVEHPDLIKNIKDEMKPDYFTNESYKKIYQYLLENSEKTDISTLMRKFEGDEEIINALSAVGIENTVFGDEKAYLEDCFLKMVVDYNNRKREEYTKKLAEPYSAEEKIVCASEIAKIDREIKKLRSKF